MKNTNCTFNTWTCNDVNKKCKKIQEYCWSVKAKVAKKSCSNLYRQLQEFDMIQQIKWKIRTWWVWKWELVVDMWDSSQAVEDILAVATVVLELLHRSAPVYWCGPGTDVPAEQQTDIYVSTSAFSNSDVHTKIKTYNTCYLQHF